MTRIDTSPSVDAELTGAAERLAQAGVSTPRREALSLWASLTGVSPAHAWTRRWEAISAHDTARFRRAVERRCSGEPFAYAVKRACFRYLDLAVDGRVLIPRPETEGLVDLALDWARTHPRSGSLRGLEVGVGSGCIVLSLATEGTFATLVGTDVSSDALGVARHNVSVVQPAVPVQWLLGNLLEPLAEETFDLIISNPPYVSEREYESLDSSVRDYEPRGALVSPNEGMLHIRTICGAAPAVLKPDGLLLLEIDERRAEPARSAAFEAGFEHIDVLPDLFGCDRYLRASKVALS